MDLVQFNDVIVAVVAYGLVRGVMDQVVGCAVAYAAEDDGLLPRLAMRLYS